MFNSLRDLLQTAPVKKKSMSRGMSLKAFHAAHKQTKIITKINQSISRMTSIVDDYSDLLRMRNIISTEGLNKSFALLVDPKNSGISKIIKNFPSNESLDAVSVSKTDRRTKAAIEGMSETLDDEPKLISEWTHTSADDINQLLSSVDDQLKDVGEAISHFLEALQVVDETTIDLTTVVEIVPYAAALSRLEALLEILPDIDAIISDPTDRDAMDIYQTKIASMIEKIGPVAGLGIDANNQCLVTMASTSDDYMVQSAALSELGYTAENTIELLKKADQLVDEISGLVERKETMVSHFHTTADTISEVDNSVPPAVDGAIGEAVDDTSSYGVTQADVYHSQISSHLYCLSVIVSVSISAVQEVLVVASELSNDDEDDDSTDDLTE